MRRLALLAPFAAAVALAAPVYADPASITITLGPDVVKEADKLGQREVDEQVEALRQTLSEELAQRGALDGARIELVLTDLKPNRPTWEQLRDRPGLDRFASRSIGGAAFEGSVTTADGRVEPVRYDWFTTNLSDVWSPATWYDAERAYQRLANNLAEGRFFR